MNAAYAIAYPADPANPPAGDVKRAAALGCQVCIGDPTAGLVKAWPSVVVMSTVAAPAVIADDSGQATLAEVQAAQAAAVAAEATAAQGVLSAQSTISTLLAQKTALEAQIATDAAMFAATAPGSAITAEHIAAFVRVVDGFATVIEAMVAHLILTGNVTP